METPDISEPASSGIPSRRVNDEKLDEVLQRLKTLEAGQEMMVQNQMSHIVDYHADLEPGQAAVVPIDEHDELKDNVTVLLDMVAGKKILDPITHQWMGHREQGIRSTIERMDRELKKMSHDANGGRGLTARIRMSDAVKIALITSGATVIVGFLTAWGLSLGG